MATLSRRSVLGAGSVSLGLLLTGCQGTATPGQSAAKLAPELKIGLSADVPDLKPSRDQGAAAMMLDTLIHRGLLGYDAQGKVVRTFTLKPVGYDKLDDNKKALNPGPWLSGKAGVNKFAWNLHSEGSVKVLGNKTAGEANEGPFVVPGTYQVQLSVGDTTLTESFEVVNDPRVKTTQKVLEADQAATAHAR